MENERLKLPVGIECDKPYTDFVNDSVMAGKAR